MTPVTSRSSSVDGAEDFLGVPVLASIPAMRSARDQEQRKRRRHLAVWWALAAALVILLVVAFVLVR